MGPVAATSQFSLQGDRGSGDGDVDQDPAKGRPWLLRMAEYLKRISHVLSSWTVGQRGFDDRRSLVDGQGLPSPALGFAHVSALLPHDHLLLVSPSLLCLCDSKVSRAGRALCLKLALETASLCGPMGQPWDGPGEGQWLGHPVPAFGSGTSSQAYKLSQEKKLEGGVWCLLWGLEGKLPWGGGDPSSKREPPHSPPGSLVAVSCRSPG